MSKANFSTPGNLPAL